MTQPGFTVLKLGGELLESAQDLRLIGARVAAATADGPLVVVHGGGRELSAELARRGETPRMIDGIRVTDDVALSVAVTTLAGTINTRLVAALGAWGVRAVGLTGVDGALLQARRSPGLRSRAGQLVDLGHVGVPVSSSDPAVLRTLCAGGWVPVVASLGVTAGGEILNINADVAAAHLAIALRAARLVVLGGTDGVLDPDGRTIPALTRDEADALIDSGAAAGGMAAKLEACARASACGVAEVRIASGRTSEASGAFGTRITAACVARVS
jgi:acetylglutamate kinase